MDGIYSKILQWRKIGEVNLLIIAESGTMPHGVQFIIRLSSYIFEFFIIKNVKRLH